jgi:uncharacterized protein (DUF488 family)
MIIYTLGYEKRNISEFIKILLDEKINKLIDVREIAWSHKRDFCKIKLSDALANSKIDYRHIKELGNPRIIRKSGLTSKEILKKYKSYLKESESGIDSLRDVINLAIEREENICLTCFEREHKDCHRSIIAELIKIKIPAVQIIHL